MEFFDLDPTSPAAWILGGIAWVGLLAMLGLGAVRSLRQRATNAAPSRSEALRETPKSRGRLPAPRKLP